MGFGKVKQSLFDGLPLNRHRYLHAVHQFPGRIFDDPGAFGFRLLFVGRRIDRRVALVQKGSKYLLPFDIYPLSSVQRPDGYCTLISYALKQDGLNWRAGQE